MVRYICPSCCFPVSGTRPEVCPKCGSHYEFVDKEPEHFATKSIDVIWRCSSCGAVHYSVPNGCDVCRSDYVYPEPSMLSKLNKCKRYYFKRPQLQEDENV